MLPMDRRKLILCSVFLMILVILAFSLTARAAAIDGQTEGIPEAATGEPEESADLPPDEIPDGGSESTDAPLYDMAESQEPPSSEKTEDMPVEESPPPVESPPVEDAPPTLNAVPILPEATDPEGSPGVDIQNGQYLDSGPPPNGQFLDSGTGVPPDMPENIAAIRNSLDIILYALIPLFTAAFLLVKLCSWFYCTFVRSAWDKF